MPSGERHPIDALRKTLSAEVPSLLKKEHIEGVSIAVVRDRKIVLTMAFGLRNAVTCEPITPQSVFEAYSLTKPLVAYQALNLCQQGLLDLDRPLDDYLRTPYMGHDPRAKRITARTVLAHTSGLPDEETARHMMFAPGERWSYST
jgi:CubicO group peptidase (beta-lactamase class C family)